MSKYTQDVIAVLDKEIYMSTNEVLKLVSKKANKTINWYMIHRILMDLFHENKVERIETTAGFFWRRK